MRYEVGGRRGTTAKLCAGLVGGGHIELCSEEVGDPRVLLNLDLCEGFVEDVVMREGEEGNHRSVLGKLVEDILNFIVRGLVILMYFSI